MITKLKVKLPFLLKLKIILRSKILTNDISMGASDRKEEWSKPPPLESINVSSAELKGNIFLRLCNILNMISAISGAMASLFHILYLIYDQWNIKTIGYVVVRIYGILFVLLIILQEMEYSSFFKYFGFLDNWVGRGLFILFCGALVHCLDELQSEKSASDGNTVDLSDVIANNQLMQTLRSCISVLLFSCGVLYITLGLLCIKSLKMRELTIIRRKKQAAIQATKLKEHKSEIEKLLRETESRLQGV